MVQDRFPDSVKCPRNFIWVGSVGVTQCRENKAKKNCRNLDQPKIKFELALSYELRYTYSSQNFKSVNEVLIESLAL